MQAKLPSLCSRPAVVGETTASIAEAMIGTESGMPQKFWERSTSDGSAVSVPGASEMSSNPNAGRRLSTLEVSWGTIEEV